MPSCRLSSDDIVRRGLAIILALATGAVAPQTARPADRTPSRTRPVAVAATVVGDAARTLVTVLLSERVEAHAFLLARPDRAIVELPGVNCQIAPQTIRPRQALVDGVRCGLAGPDRSRLVIDLIGPATVKGIVQETSEGGDVRLTIELAKSDRDNVSRASRAPDIAPETTGSLPSRDPVARPPIVAIDAGHGGFDPGATATTGDAEKDIVLAFARALRDRLVARGIGVVMTRDADVFVALDERVKLARSAGADLFVSIHGDFIGSPQIRGATIYTGAERATDADSARLAERENAADASAGLLPEEARAGLHDILSDLTVRETRGLSHRFAGLLHSRLAPVTRLSAQPHREAGLRVLRAADMTSVLVELGYLSNARDSDLLRSDDWRAGTTAAMAEAIERFFGPRHAKRAAVSP